MTDNAIDTMLNELHLKQRQDRICAAGLKNDAAFQAALAQENPPLWKDFRAPPVSIELQHSLAEKLYNAEKGDTALINLGDGSRHIGPWLVEKCRKEGIPFVVQFSDANFMNLALNHASDEGVRNLAANFLALTAPVTTIITARSGMQEHDVPVDPQKDLLYRRETKPYGDRLRSGDLFYTLTVIPTPVDAQIDHFAYDDYIKLFFEMCDQPWNHISTAQKALIGEFNTARTVRITNDDGTDVSMELVDNDGLHFTFCNSLIAKNVPGSEIFSAPRRDSVNGTVVAKGRFEHNHNLIEDLTMEFKDGKLVSYSAAKNVAAFERAIAADSGAKYVGELGIGTNPHLNKHVANGLLVEKIGGSFHLALGASYSYTSYEGEPVKVNNGNQSALHWDITTMLRGRGGKIYLDDRLVMDNGLWLDPRYKVLNEGWKAIPKNVRPEYWKNYDQFNCG